MSHVSKAKASCRCLDSSLKIGSLAVATTTKRSIPEGAETVRRGFRKESASRCMATAHTVEFSVHMVR